MKISSSQKIAKIITSVDIFGQGISLRINKEIQAKTFLGGVLSIIMIVLLSTMFFFSAQDVLYHQNPQITIEQVIVNTLPNITLDKYSMPIAISLTNNSNLGMFMPNYFNYHMIYTYGDTSAEALIEEPLNLTLCRKEFFPLISQEKYDQLNMNNNLCTENQNFTIGGSFAEKWVAYLTLRISICLNNENKTNCAPFSEIKNFLDDNQLYFNIYHMNTYINPQNSSTPITYGMLNFYKSINYGSYKISELFIRNQKLLSDDGFIMKTTKINETISFDYSNFDDSNFDKNEILVEFSIMASSSLFTYYRSYMKIQQVLANVGGLANVMRIFLVLVCYIFSIVKRDEFMMNKIFEYDIIDDNEKIVGFKQKPHLFVSDEKSKYNLNKVNIDKYGRKEKNAKNNSLSNHTPTLIFENFNNLQVVSPTSSPVLNDKFKTEHNSKSHITSINEVNRRHSSKGFSSDEIRSPESNTILKKIDNKSIEFELHDNKSNQKFKANLSSTNLVKNITDKDIHNNDTSQLNEAKKIIEILNSRNKKYELKFSFSEIIRAFLCFKCCSNHTINAKKSLYKKSNFIVEEFLDITYIVQKFDEFEKLKIVLLNEEQIALFNFIAKELMSLDEEKVKNHDMTKFKQLNKDREQLANLIIKFRNRALNEEIQGIDRKLFNLLNEEFK